MEEQKQDLQETENQDPITAQPENSVEDTENKMRIELEEQKDKYICMYMYSGTQTSSRTQKKNKS